MKTRPVTRNIWYEETNGQADEHTDGQKDG